MSNIISVKNLSVNVATGGPQEDPYGQGFASLTAEFESKDNELIEQLINLKNKKTIVKLQCAMLEVTGHITNALPKNHPVKFIVSVEDIIYCKPKEPWEK